MVRTQGPLTAHLLPNRLNFEATSPTFKKSTTCAISQSVFHW